MTTRKSYTDMERTRRAYCESGTELALAITML